MGGDKGGGRGGGELELEGEEGRPIRARRESSLHRARLPSRRTTN